MNGRGLKVSQIEVGLEPAKFSRRSSSSDTFQRTKPLLHLLLPLSFTCPKCAFPEGMAGLNSVSNAQTWNRSQSNENPLWFHLHLKFHNIRSVLTFISFIFCYLAVLTCTIKIQASSYVSMVLSNRLVRHLIGHLSISYIKPNTQTNQWFL